MLDWAVWVKRHKGKDIKRHKGKDIKRHKGKDIKRHKGKETHNSIIQILGG